MGEHERCVLQFFSLRFLILQQWRPIPAWLLAENRVHEYQEEYYQALNIAQHNGEAEEFAAFMLRLMKAKRSCRRSGNDRKGMSQMIPGRSRNFSVMLSHTRSRSLMRDMYPKTLQYLMGHSDIGVTMNTYTHLGLEDAVTETNRLQQLESARKEQAALEGKTDEVRISKKMFRVG